MRTTLCSILILCSFLVPMTAHGFSGVDVADFRPPAPSARLGAQAVHESLARRLLGDPGLQGLNVSIRVQLLSLATDQVAPLTDRDAPFAESLVAHLQAIGLSYDNLSAFLRDLENAKQRDITAAQTAPFLVPAFEFSDHDKNILSQLRPGLSLGVPDELGRGLRLLGTLRLASPIDADETDEYAETLVSSGTFNVSMGVDYTLPLFRQDRGSLRVIPFGMVKLRPGLADSTSAGTDVVFAQHGLGLAAVFQYANTLLLSAHHVWAWHNLTTDSETHFFERFTTRTITDVRYWNVGVQINTGKIGGQQTSFYLEWRALVNEDAFADFGDTKTLVFGFRDKIAFDL